MQLLGAADHVYHTDYRDQTDGTHHTIYVSLSHNHDFYKHSKQNKYIFLVSSQSFLVSNINQGGQLDFESTRNQGDWDREGLSYSKSPRSSSARYRRLKF